MKIVCRFLIAFSMVFLLAGPGTVWATGELRIAELGDFPLENGQVIRDCRLGYRTFGKLDEKRANALLFPTWLVGSSEDLVKTGFIGPGKLADTGRYFVVAVDSLGNGVSSSPSRKGKQTGRSFPEFSVRDMVRAQHQLLTRHLDLQGLHAVVGISMGGMQALAWMRSYPGFARKTVSIVGTPRPTAGDLLLFNAELRAIEGGGGDGPEGEAARRRTLAAIHAFAVRNPQYYLRRLPPAEVPSLLAEMEKSLNIYHLDDWAWQLKAIIRHDASVPPPSAPVGTGTAKPTRLLVVVARDDLLVNPEPALSLAKVEQGETLELTGGCGHFSFLCEAEKIRRVVTDFLRRED